MLWRSWTFVVGLALGPLCVLAVVSDPTLAAMRFAAVGGGLALVAASSLIARWRDDDPARGAHFAWAAGAAALAWPALGLALLDLAPGATGLAAICAAAMVLCFALGARARGPCAAWRIALSAVAWPVAGGVVLAAASAVIAALGATEPEFDDRRALAIYEFDARVPTRALPDCLQEVAASRIVADRGAHPRWSADGRWIWFDAADAEGRRQVHRLDADAGGEQCWTCGQPGNNARPAPGPDGAVVVYDSDRHATWSTPSNTEIYATRVRGAEPPAAGRRLTHHPGPDDHALLGPSSRLVLWSRRERGRYFVASAAVLEGHGGVVLQQPGVLHAGGAAWAAPLAWTRDARRIVFVRGNPYRALDAVVVDPASGDSRWIAADVPGNAGVGFNDDGGWLAVARSQRAHAAGAAPDWMGFALGSFATRAELTRPLFRGTQLVTGAAAAKLDAVDLDAIGEWGAPTGVASSPDGRRVVLGQRRLVAGAGIAERLVEIRLVCREDGA